MTEKHEKYGCLSKSLRDFLFLSEEKRKKKYGSGVYKMYERVIDNVDYSFQDCQIAYVHLPDDYRKKIDLITNYESMLREIKQHKITRNLPDIAISSVITELEGIVDRPNLDNKLKKLAEKDFDKVIDWLRFLEPKRQTKSVDTS